MSISSGPEFSLFFGNLSYLRTKRVCMLSHMAGEADRKVNPKIVQTILGHADSTTFRYYAHSDVDVPGDVLDILQSVQVLI
jgi:integrase